MEPRFTSEEITLVAARVGNHAGWLRWSRETRNGRDIVEIAIAGEPSRRLRVAKTARGSYVAVGVRGWSMTIGEDLGALLDVLAQMTDTRGPTASSAWPHQSAA